MKLVQPLLVFTLCLPGMARAEEIEAGVPFPLAVTAKVLETVDTDHCETVPEDCETTTLAQPQPYPHFCEAIPTAPYCQHYQKLKTRH